MGASWVTVTDIGMVGAWMRMPGYSNISIPVGLRSEIEKLIHDLEKEEIDLGYKTVAEFVKEAIRKRVEELRQIYFLGEKDRK